MANKISIESIKVNDFCGIESLELNFDSKSNSIYARNGGGKTSIIKAIYWVLGLNVSNFYPTDNNREIIGKVPRVKIALNVNDLVYELERILETKYVEDSNGCKVKKSATNKFSIDDILFAEKVYTTRICELFGVDNISMLDILINKEVFNGNTTKWNWKNRRALLMSMVDANEINEKIIYINPQYEFLSDSLRKGIKPTDILTKIKSSKKFYQEQQKTNALRLEIAEKDLNSVKNIDFKAIESQINDKKTMLEYLYKKLDGIATYADTDLSREFDAVQARRDELIAKKNAEDREIRHKISSLNVSIKALNDRVKHAETVISRFEEEVDNKNLIRCPKCGERIRMWCNHIYDKSSSEQEKNDLVAQIEKEEIELANVYQERTALEAGYDANIAIENSKLRDLNERINNQCNEDRAIVKQQIEQCNDDLISLKLEYNKKGLLEQSLNTINDIKLEQKQITNNLIECERREKLINDFISLQCYNLQCDINSHFNNGISFTLFNIINNNGEPKVGEECELMYNGKTYTTLSTGQKGFVDIEILRVLQEFYDLQSFILVDNAESITDYNDTAVAETNQMIKFYAQKDCEIEGMNILRSDLI